MADSVRYGTLRIYIQRTL